MRFHENRNTQIQIYTIQRLVIETVHFGNYRHGEKRKCKLLATLKVH